MQIFGCLLVFLIAIMELTPSQKPIGQTVDRDRPVDRQQFGGRSQIFLIQKKATIGYWYVFRLSVRIASFLVWWLSMILRTYL